MSASVAIIFSKGRSELPVAFTAWLDRLGVPRMLVHDEEELMSVSLRSRPRIAILDARTDVDSALEACARLKTDSYTAVVPAVLLCKNDPRTLDRGFASGADEVIHEQMSGAEAHTRLNATLRRSDRDVEVHPSTRLPGAAAIEAELARRIGTGEAFAMCYADLDHFKEFNDRYSYYDGDRVIRILAKILHDVVKGICGERGFVGHIGGDDFIFVVPTTEVAETCSEIVNIFDLIVPFQYSEPDRRAGYFFGKDRRGQLHRVPLMTLSIGVVTNERRVFTSPAHVSELATEMKSYAKTLTGSVFSIDRRQDHLISPESVPARPEQAATIIED